MPSELLSLDRTTAKNFTNDELLSLLGKSILLTAECIRQMAIIWLELESRGVDLNSYKSGLMVYLSEVAKGKLDPEIIIRCAGQQMLLKAVSSLSIKDQRQILVDGVDVVDISKDGKEKVQSLPLERIPTRVINQLFNGNKIRNKQQQSQMLKTKDYFRDKSKEYEVNFTISVGCEDYKKLLNRANSHHCSVAKLSSQIIEDEIRKWNEGK